jgi:hypothetical protein
VTDDSNGSNRTARIERLESNGSNRTARIERLESNGSNRTVNRLSPWGRSVLRLNPSAMAIMDHDPLDGR